MPIRPNPVTYSCPSCGWSTTFAPRSDVLLESPPDVCPKCSQRNLVCRPTHLPGSVLGGLADAVKRMFS